eukprot:TRINITY_DN7972_c0_g1_i1.p1 TRINITY_DN7972_c0_g1~~TRINITY_DN7972_c0_g1_i1.p1  ORF type:complete len:255 (+),score=67.31 TRINITY_DN7972_c0_g1_i1:990-1754(+)
MEPICPVCLEVFCTAGDMLPYKLRCGHALCKSDIMRILETAGGKAMSCPLCRSASGEKDVTPDSDMVQLIRDYEAEKACVVCRSFYGHTEGRCSRCWGGWDERDEGLREEEDRTVDTLVEGVRGRLGFMTEEKEKMVWKVVGCRPSIEEYVQMFKDIGVNTMMASQAQRLLREVGQWSLPPATLEKYYHATLYMVLDTWNLPQDEPLTCDYATIRPQPTAAKHVTFATRRCDEDPDRWRPIEEPVEVRRYWRPK